MWLRRLAPADAGALRALLAQDPEAHMFVLSRLRDDGSEIAPGAHAWGAFQGDSLCGAAYWQRGGLLVPSACETEAQRLLARLLENVPGGWRYLVCREDDAHEFLSEAARLGAALELSRRQVFYVLRERAAPRDPEAETLRPAESRDVPELVEMSFALAEEDLAWPRTGRQEEAMRAGVAARVAAGEIFVAGADGVAFKAVVGTRHAKAGAQIEGIFTRPGARRLGIARRALASMCARLLAETPFVCLHVGEANAPARALYESLGFSPAGFFRLARRAPYA